jgi:DNA-binding transcriptional LysR family regulator
MSLRPEFRHLRYFIAVAELCNIGRAAGRLHVSQPALSEQIKQLEDIMRVPLFVRGRSGSTLTPEGRAFLPFAKDLIAMLEQAIHATSSEHSGTKLPLRLGYSPFVDHSLVDHALTIFCELVPHGKVDPTSETTGRLSNMVAEGQIEAAIVTLPIPNRDLFVKELCEERVLVCLRKDDPLAGLDALPREVIANRLKVFFDRSHQPMFYDKAMRRFAKHGIHLNPTEFVPDPAEMQFLIRRSKNMGLLLESTNLSPDLVFKKVDGVSLKITTALICLKNQQRPVLPILAFKLNEKCQKAVIHPGMRKPPSRVTSSEDLGRKNAA